MDIVVIDIVLDYYNNVINLVLVDNDYLVVVKIVQNRN